MSTMTSLTQLLFRQKVFNNTLSVPISVHTQYSPLLILISWIYFLPLSWRKLIIDVCRVQVQPTQNNHLAIAYGDLELCIYAHDVHPVKILYNYEFDQLLGRVCYSPLLLSFLSYFARAETTIHVQEFLAERDKSLEKEFQAAILAQVCPQVLDYSPIFVSNAGRLHPQLKGSMNQRVWQMITTGIQRVISKISDPSTPALLPAYNAKKNVAYSTQRSFLFDQGFSPQQVDESQMFVTSLHLLKHYYVTGSQIQGPLEVRQAWFYNDLKPRTYYCLGGTDYFAGMYIQQISNLFVSILPSTDPKTRFEVSRVGQLSQGQLLITYDYSSFTTSLSELRYFLFWLSEICRGHAVTLLDVHSGLRTVDLGEVLAEYNSIVNHYQEFSLERFAKDDETHLFRQGRNGSLGVKGNIVFSTTLHGVALADLTGTPENDLVVGDDALSAIYTWLLSLFILCVNNLGVINQEKFTTIELPSQSVAPHQTQFKFLKRPIFVDTNGTPQIGTLDFYPSIADALFPKGDGIHSSRPNYSIFGAARAFAMQVGRFLNLLLLSEQSMETCDEEELELVLSSIQLVYKRFGMPLSGGVPGSFYVANWELDSEVKSDFFLPACDSIEIFKSNWLYELMFRFNGTMITMPRREAAQPCPLSLHEGQTFVCTSGVAVYSLMEALGFLEKTVLTEQLEFCDENLRRIEEMLRTKESEDEFDILCRYVVLSVPDWYTEYALRYLSDDDTVDEDPNEAWERLSVSTGGLL